MQAFHNDPAIKAKYVQRIQAHMHADNIIRGTGWDGHKGCAVGCTLENYDHSLYPVELGIPEWLGRLEDTLFEGMSAEKAKTWALDFLIAAKEGANLETVKAPFLIMVLKSTLETFDHEKFPEVRAAVDGSIALWQRPDIGSTDWTRAAWAAAGAWAEGAAWAAWAEAEAAKFDYFADQLLQMMRNCQPEVTQ